MNSEGVVDQVVEELKRIRGERGLSLRELAEQTGLSHSGIGHIEQKSNTPTLLSLLLISEALEFDLGQFVSSLTQK